METADQFAARLVAIIDPKSCYAEEFDALENAIKARDAAAKLEALEELKGAMVNEMARINRGRGFKDTDEIHGILPEQLRLLCAKYRQVGGSNGNR